MPIDRKLQAAWDIFKPNSDDCKEPHNVTALVIQELKDPSQQYIDTFRPCKKCNKNLHVTIKPSRVTDLIDGFPAYRVTMEEAD